MGYQRAQRASLRALRASSAFVAMCCVLLFARAARADGQDYREQVEAPVTPSWLTLPFEYGDAAAWAKGRTGPVYRFSAALLPGVMLSRLNLHLSLQALYRNPGWNVGTGGRISYLLAAPLGGFLPLRVIVEGSYLPVSRRAYFASGVSLGLGGLLQVVPLYGYDTDLETHFVSVRLGIDLLALGDPIAAVTRYVPQQDYRPVP